MGLPHRTVLPGRRQAVVFNSTSQPSQFNYMFGIACELAKRQALGPDVDIYYMTDNTRKELIESTKGLKFLDLGPLPEVQSDLSKIMSNARAPPRSPKTLVSISTGFWEDPDVIMNCIHRSHDHLKELKPMLVILDQFSRALDAAMKLRIPYIMCGNECLPTSKPTDRSVLASLVTCPTICCGNAGDLTWYQGACQFIAMAEYMVRMLTHPVIRNQAARRRKELDEPRLPYATLDRSYGSDLEHGEIWAFPRSVLYQGAEFKTVFPVGPTFAAQFEGERGVVSSLQGWMDEAPLVYINMGTLFKFKDEDLHVWVATFRDLCTPSETRAASLVTSDTHRFLWKLPKKPLARLNELYPDFLSSTNGRVRIETWVDYPSAILQHPNTYAVIHHGGANSFAEAGWFGIPQIILPQWADCYDTAAHVRHMGLGLCNPAPERTLPYISSPDFATLINDTLAGGPQGYESFKRKAEEFAEECRESGGAVRAAEIIEETFRKEFEHWDGRVEYEQSKLALDSSTVVV